MFGAHLVYFVLVFLAGLGIIRLVSADSNISRFEFIRRSWPKILVSGILIIPAAIGFFIGEDYFHFALIQGTEQAVLFSLAGVVALAFNALVRRFTAHFVRSKGSH